MERGTYRGNRGNLRGTRGFRGTRGNRGGRGGRWNENQEDVEYQSNNSVESDEEEPLTQTELDFIEKKVADHKESLKGIVSAE